MKTILKTSITVKDICEGFVYNELEGKGLFGLSGKLTIQPEYQRNYIYASDGGKKEIEHLNRIGNMYLDYAEMQAARGKAMTMQDWIVKLNAFLKFSEYEILTNAGKVSHEVAEALALKEYEKYRVIQDKNYISDFDRVVKQLKKRGNKITKK